MIGQLILPVSDVSASSLGKARLRATLDDSLRWHCSDPEWASVLNAQFVGAGNGDASAGRFVLYRAAERLGARVQLGEAIADAVA